MEQYNRLATDYKRKESELNIATNELAKAERKIKDLSRKLLQQVTNALQRDDAMQEASEALEKQQEQYIQTIKLMTAEKETA
jgi:uncharacterized protein involved in exopolysaccharide biosynthesis